MPSPLTSDQVERLAAIALSLADVLEMPLDDWLTDLRRECDPEKHLLTWEAYAAVYKQFTTPSDPKVRRQDVLQVCLLFTRHLPFLPKSERYKALTDEEVDQLCAALTERLT